MFITILFTIINRFAMELYFVHRIMIRYHYYWYVILIVNTPKKGFMLRKRFTNGNQSINQSIKILLIIRYNYLIIIVIIIKIITTFPTILTPYHVTTTICITIYHQDK